LENVIMRSSRRIAQIEKIENENLTKAHEKIEIAEKAN
jgi:hypothetical protein